MKNSASKCIDVMDNKQIDLTEITSLSSSSILGSIIISTTVYYERVIILKPYQRQLLNYLF